MNPIASKARFSA